MLNVLRDTMDLLRLTGLAMLEGYGAQRVLPEYHFRTTFLACLGGNLLLTAFYNVAVYPFLVNPLRHLPTVKVCWPRGTGEHRPETPYMETENSSLMLAWAIGQQTAAENHLR